MPELLSFLAPPTPYRKPSTIYTILTQPFPFVARQLYNAINFLRPSPKPQNPPIRVVCISDTHTFTTDIPIGDLLIHAGDLTNAGTVPDVQDQIDWLKSLPHKHKVVIAGNHETYLDPRSRLQLSKAEQARAPPDWADIHYLQHRAVTLNFPHHKDRELTIYGAPHTKRVPSHPEFSFTYEAHQDAWSDTIPRGIDVLVTHGPPRWHMDLMTGLGCKWLLKECWRVKARLHVFGHIHEGRGRENCWWDKAQAAMERIGARERGAIGGLFDVGNWKDLFRIYLHGMKALMWTLVWGGEEDGSVMVNAALIDEGTKKLGNAPQVVEI